MNSIRLRIFQLGIELNKNNLYFFQVCPDHTSGENCQECDSGYARDPASRSCIAMNPQEPNGCMCDAVGSVNGAYLNGKHKESSVINIVVSLQSGVSIWLPTLNRKL